MKLKEFFEFLSSMHRKAKGSQILLRIINFLTFMKADYNKLKVKLNDILRLELSKEKTDLKGWVFLISKLPKAQSQTVPIRIKVGKHRRISV